MPINQLYVKFFGSEGIFSEHKVLDKQRLVF